MKQLNQPDFTWQNPHKAPALCWKAAAHPLTLFRGLAAKPNPADSLAFLFLVLLTPLALAFFLGKLSANSAATRLATNFFEGVFLAWLLYLTANRLFRARAGFERMLAVFCLSSWPWLFYGLIPWLSKFQGEMTLAGLLVLRFAYLLVGMRVALKMPAWQSVGSTLIGLVGLLLVEFLLGTLFTRLGAAFS